MSEYLTYVKSALRSNGLRYHDAGRPVKRVAVLGGSGSDAFAAAMSSGADTYITADVKYDVFLQAKALGMNLIDADHFCTENTVVPVLHEAMSHEFKDIDFMISGIHCQTAQFI